jgi:hypothetical protein
MPDITMCRSTDCPREAKCYRFMAKPSMRQSYMDFKALYKGKCRFFMTRRAEKRPG